MKNSILLFALPLALLFTVQSLSAQIWKNSERKQAINREATVKKRIINNENALKITKDPEIQKIYEERIALLKSCQQDIVEWNKATEADEKQNSHRYNLLTNLKLGKVDALQALINIRTSEVVYETFGGDFTEEPVAILKDLRQNARNCLPAFDEAISKVKANIN